MERDFFVVVLNCLLLLVCCFNVLILERKTSICSGSSASRTTPSLAEFCTANMLLSLVLHMIQLVFVLSYAVSVTHLSVFSET